MGENGNGNENPIPSIYPTVADPPDMTYSSAADLGLPSNFGALPSMNNYLHDDSDMLFMSIRSGDHTEVESILADRGHVVDIVPRIGCSPLHYSKFNLANREAKNGDTPLIMAARVDSKMVNIVLNYGGNPNHANKDRDTPLSVAASRSDREAINALLLAGANLRAAVVKMTSLLKHITSEDQLQGYGDLACNVKPLTFLLSDDVYLKCRCPIKSAFDVGKDIANIQNVRDEFKMEFELLIEDANEFTCRFLNNIDRMWEAREILTSPVDLITMAIDLKKKKFVSHPFCQQIINGRWYGKLANKMFHGKAVIAIQYFFSPFLFLPLLLKFLFFDVCRGVPVMDSSFTSLLRLKFTPFLCFITDALNYIAFLFILICVCLIEQSIDEITSWEMALYVCIISRIFIELDVAFQQGWKRYFANVWNQVDCLILLLVVISALYKGYVTSEIYTQKHTSSNSSYVDELNHFRSLNFVNESGSLKLSDTWRISNDTKHFMEMVIGYQDFLNISYMYAVAEFILFLRLLTLLEVTRSMGPMMIALKYLLLDVLKFSVLLFTTIFGASITIYSMSVTLAKLIRNVDDLCTDLNKQNATFTWSNTILLKFFGDMTDKETELKNSSIFCENVGKIKPPPSFQSFLATVTSIMWSTFGLFDVSKVTKPFDPSTINFVNVILVLYILLSCVLLLNMLIGILSSTFDRIQDNCDVEWKYARSELLKEYSETQPFFIPFSFILLPLVIWFRRKLKKEQRKTFKKTHAADQEERDKIISEICARFQLDFPDVAEEYKCAAKPRQKSAPKPPGSAQDKFDARVRRLRRQKSELQQFKKK